MERLVEVERTGLSLCYETFGEPSGPPVLLVMGLATQMVAWPDELCRGLGRRGYFVVRFDNRDTGRSSHLSDLKAPPPLRVLLRRSEPPYRLEDMAEDSVGLLEALGIGSAHVVGASMGGFISQLIALNHPQRVRSLTLIMTSTGSLRVGRARLSLIARLARRRPPPRSEAEAVALTLDILRQIGSTGYVPDEQYLSEIVSIVVSRAQDPTGYSRQLAAVLAQSDRTRRLSGIDVPTVVIHGLADPLVAPSGGRALARAIPGARFVGLPGMGHDLPRPIWERVADEIESIARTGEAARQPATA